MAEETVQFSVRLPRSLVARLEALAAREDRTRVWEIKRAVEERLEREEKKLQETP